MGSQLPGMHSRDASSAVGLALGAAFGMLLVVRMNKLVEVAMLARRCLLLVDQLEVRFVELFEEILPRDFIQRSVVVILGFRELEAQNPRLFSRVCTAHLSRHRPAPLCPLSDLFIICSCF